MYTILCLAFLGPIIALTINVINWFRYGHRVMDFDKEAAFFIGPLMAGIMGSFIGFLIAVAAYDMAPKAYVETGRYQMHSMRDANGVEGHLFLGSGTINSRDYYSYYLVQRNGAFHKYQASISQSDIFEQDRTDGVLVTLRPQCRGSWENWVVEFVTQEYCQFYIPKGSVVQNFRLE